MTIKLRRVIAPAALLTILCALAPAAMGQGAAPATPRRPAVIVFDGSMAALLGAIAQTYGVTLGLELDPRKPTPHVKINLNDPTLSDVLNAVTQYEPAYRWREGANGSIDVYPAAGASPLLDTVIVNFQIRDLSWAEAGDALIGMPELRAGTTAAQLGGGQVRRPQWSRRNTEPPPARFSLNLQNVSARTALHEITRGSGGHFWVFGLSGKEFYVSNF